MAEVKPLLQAQTEQKPEPSVVKSALDNLNVVNANVLDTLAFGIDMNAIGEIPTLGDDENYWRETDIFEAGFPPPKPGYVQYGVRVEWRDGTSDQVNFRRKWNDGYRPRIADESDGKKYSTSIMGGKPVYYVAGHLLMETTAANHARLVAIQNRRIEAQSAGVRLAEDAGQFDPRQVRFSGNASARVSTGRDATALVD